MLQRPRQSRATVAVPSMLRETLVGPVPLVRWLDAARVVDPLQQAARELACVARGVGDDVTLTSSAHDGELVDGRIDDPETLPLLAGRAVARARANDRVALRSTEGRRASAAADSAAHFFFQRSAQRGPAEK